jgi:hypothetical protein
MPVLSPHRRRRFPSGRSADALSQCQASRSVGVSKLLDARGLNRNFDGDYITPLNCVLAEFFASGLELYSFDLG